MLAGLHERGFTDLVAAHLDVFQYPGPENQRPLELATQTRMTKQALNYLLGQLAAARIPHPRNRQQRPTLQTHPPDPQRTRRDHSDPRNRPRRRSRMGTATRTPKVRATTRPPHAAIHNHHPPEPPRQPPNPPAAGEAPDGLAPPAVPVPSRPINPSKPREARPRSKSNPRNKPAHHAAPDNRKQPTQAATAAAPRSENHHSPAGRATVAQRSRTSSPTVSFNELDQTPRAIPPRSILTAQCRRTGAIARLLLGGARRAKAELSSPEFALGDTAQAS